MHTATRPAPTWDACCHLLQGRLSAQHFRRWIATPDLAASVRNDHGYWVLTLACTTPQRCHELDFAVGTTIERAWHELCQTASRVEYVVQQLTKCEPTEKLPAKIIQFPLWPESKRGVPNDFLRSALFAAIEGKSREYMERQDIASWEGVSLRYTGKQLDQSDRDVWEQVIHLIREHPLGNISHFRAHSFLKAIGRSTGKSNHDWLHGVLNRLRSCTVEVQKGQKIQIPPDLVVARATSDVRVARAAIFYSYTILGAHFFVCLWCRITLTISTF